MLRRQRFLKLEVATVVLALLGETGCRRVAREGSRRGREHTDREGKEREDRERRRGVGRGFGLRRILRMLLKRLF
jgi:hypothetical protein